MWNVAVVGATGVLGKQILEILEERSFPVKELRFLDVEETEEAFLDFRGDSILVQQLSAESFAGIDIALFAAGSEISQTYCPVAGASGAISIDLSGAWAMDPDVPLVVPEINPEILTQYAAKRIVANPSSAVIGLTSALKSLHDDSRIKRVVVSTYQAVSEVGQGAIDELRDQSGELLNGRPSPGKVFPHQVAFNCLPQVGGFLPNGYSVEEMKIINETGKVLAAPEMKISATAVYVPVFYGNAEAVTIETEEKISADRVRELLEKAPGIEVVDDCNENRYPLQADAAGEDSIYIGRIREEISVPHGISLWIVTDNLRKGAATNAVQIAEILAGEVLSSESSNG